MDLRPVCHHWHSRWRNILMDGTRVFVIICRLVSVQDLWRAISCDIIDKLRNIHHSP